MRRIRSNDVCGHHDAPHKMGGRCEPCYVAHRRLKDRERYHADLRNERVRRSKKHHKYDLGTKDWYRYGEVKAASGDTCPICGDVDRQMQCDHDHVTGYFRQCICNKCNSRVAAIENGTAKKIYPELLEYIARWKELHAPLLAAEQVDRAAE